MGPAHVRTDEAVGERSDQLAAQWRDQTAHLSSVTQRVAHPSTQQFIGLGAQAVACLIEPLRQATDQWLSALVAIVGADHAPGARPPSCAATRWVVWCGAASPADLTSLFPLLGPGTFSISSPADQEYNCHASAAVDDTARWSPTNPARLFAARPPEAGPTPAGCAWRS